MEPADADDYYDCAPCDSSYEDDYDDAEGEYEMADGDGHAGGGYCDAEYAAAADGYGVVYHHFRWSHCTEFGWPFEDLERGRARGGRSQRRGEGG